MTQIVCMTNQKGGVGKTTTTGSVGIAAVNQGLRVLAVDADPQGNLTSAVLPDDFPQDHVGLADVLTDQADTSIQDAIVGTAWEGFDIVPTVGLFLYGVRKELTNAPVGREYRLREALEPIAADYDLILIDCPPALDDLTFNVYTASDSLVIVAEPDMYSANGIAQLLDAVGNIRRYCNAGLEISGMVINKYRKNTLDAEHWRRELVEAGRELGIRILEPTIPQALVISTALQTGQGLYQIRHRRAPELARKYEQLFTQITKAPAGKDD